MKPPYTQKQGQYLAFIHAYTKLHGCPPAETDIQRYFRVTPPAVHLMILTLEKRGLISRVPRQPRTIRVLVPPEILPNLGEVGTNAASSHSRSGAADRKHDLRQRLDRLDWPALQAQLWEFGYCKTPPVLTPAECQALVNVYPDDTKFRRRIDMARYRFGEGEYKYFSDPLPSVVQTLRVHTYPPLAGIANAWMEALRKPDRYPDTLPAFLDVCRASGQTKPTPLLLRYETGGYNCLHQDLYGEVAFPLQLTCFLSWPGDDYTGGAFLLVEQRPRAQSCGDALTPAQGEMVIFATQYRPVAGTRGYYRTTMRHGVGRVTSGRRYTLGVIYHNAQ
jgi:hypothetical protein